ncbi:MAG: hypothetical protein H8E78_03980 [Proteobacteria bacterium]|nr:hypothetical protein [Pseudomonadota bacterium]
MHRAQGCALLGSVLMLAAASTEAREMNFLVDSSLGWDSNVFQRSARTRSDGYWEFSPRVIVRDSRDELEYDVRYRPTFQAFFNEDNIDIDDWDHNARVDIDWLATPADTLTLGGSITRTRVVRQFQDDPASITPPDRDEFILTESDREIILRSLARLGYRRSFSASLSGQFDFSFEDIDYRSDQSVDSRSYSASAGLTGLFNSRTQGGFSATGRIRQGRGIDFLPSPVVGQFSSRTLTGDFSFFVLRLLTPSLSLSLRAGPSITQTEQDAPPSRQFGLVLDPLTGEPEIKRIRGRTSSEQSVSFVADASLEKQWRRSTGKIGYTRFESGTGGSSSASIVDQVTVSLNHRPAPRVTINLVVSWNQREVISDLESSVQSDSRRYSGTAAASYAITRQVSILGRFSYRQFEDKNTTTSKTEIILGSIIFRYSFDPVRF